MCKSSLRTLDYKPGSRPIFTQLPERELVSIFMYVVKYRILTHLPNYTFNREKSVFCSLFSNWMCDIDQRKLFLLAPNIVCLCLYKGPMFVLPFVMLMFVDLGLSFFSLLNGDMGLPGTPKYKDVLQVAVRKTTFT